MAKYMFFQNGISPAEFRKCQMRDIRDLQDLENAIEENKKQRKKVKDKLNELARKKQW